jgi:hypothetical protein
MPPCYLWRNRLSLRLNETWLDSVITFNVTARINQLAIDRFAVAVSSTKASTWHTAKAVVSDAA